MAAQKEKVLLAGTLEKRSRWIKEWKSRFCVVRGGQIDYFIAAPTFVDDIQEAPRGVIHIKGDAFPTQETGHPFCISVGNELLSCSSRMEQQRWLDTISMVRGSTTTRPARATTEELTPALSRLLNYAEATARTENGFVGPELLLLPPEEPPRKTSWHHATSVLLTGRHATPSVLFLDGDDSGTGTSALCRLALHDVPRGKAAFPLLTVNGWDTRIRLHVRVLSSERAPAAPGRFTLATSNALGASCLLALALSLLVAGQAWACGACIVLATVLLLAEKACEQLSPQRRVTFVMERLALADEGLDRAPRWVGCWRLDRPRSEAYEAVLADLGVTYSMRKAADAAVPSTLAITTSETQVTIRLQSSVTVEDSVPLDGSWVTKAVPPGSSMQGECRVRVTKHTGTELEMLTEFPDNWGELRDCVTVSEDGRSFSRHIARSDTLAITRYFSRETEF